MKHFKLYDEYGVMLNKNLEARSMKDAILKCANNINEECVRNFTLISIDTSESRTFQIDSKLELINHIK